MFLVNNLICNYLFQAFVHVSTAYSNADKSEVLEVVYPPPADPEHVIQICQTLNDEALEVVTQRLQGKHPNTYTLTKAMAEWVVAEQADDLPAAIVRPSIGKNNIFSFKASYLSKK